MSASVAEDSYRFDPADQALVRDPYPVYRQLLARPGLHAAAGGYHVATRHVDCRQVLSSPAFGQGDFIRNIQLFYGPDFDVLGQSAYRWLSEVFLMQDPPHHTRLRKLVSFALTPKRIADMAPRIQALQDGLVDAWLAKGGTGDVVHELAYPLPVLVMFDLLGVEEHERTPETMATLTRAIAEAFLVFETRVLSAAELALANRQMDALYEYFGALFDRRRADPRDDLTSALASVRDESGDALSHREMVTIVIAMFGAGFETTAHLISNGLHTLQRHPEQWARLLADPTLASGVVEEVLRFESSLQATYRTALEDTSVDGTYVRGGERVLCIVAAANRDPAVFKDPDRFDITRRDTRLLSFGGGIHHCIGQALARLEGRIAFESIARRLPGISVQLESPPWRPGFLFRGLESLPATTRTA
ncbi:MAG: cytochrome P450 [Gammaproteobacteria bacterium]